MMKMIIFGRSREIIEKLSVFALHRVNMSLISGTIDDDLDEQQYEWSLNTEPGVSAEHCHG